MNQKEFFLMSVGVFLTMVAFVINTLYHIENGVYINQEIKPVTIPLVNIDTKVFDVLKEKTE